MRAFGYSITPPLFLHVHARANVIVYTRKQGTNFFCVWFILHLLLLASNAACFLKIETSPLPYFHPHKKNHSSVHHLSNPATQKSHQIINHTKFHLLRNCTDATPTPHQ